MELKEGGFEIQIDSFLRSYLYCSKDIVIDRIEKIPWIIDTFEAFKLLELDPTTQLQCKHLIKLTKNSLEPTTYPPKLLKNRKLKPNI